MMSETKWTPGPWSVADDGCIRCSDANADYLIYASPWRSDAWSGDVQAIANGTLMAAAPDLYDALNRMLANYRSDGSEASERDIEIARAALAKARGET
jgi:hypothetical protein